MKVIDKHMEGNIMSQNSELRTQNIRSFTGIKVLALFLIFYQHSNMPLLPFGLGSRMCELLFVLSGFLVGYNKFHKEIEYSWSTGINYVVSKLIIFYPLHILIVILRCILEYKSFVFTNTWIKLILSLLLITPWFPNEEVFFCFNGSSWFLCSLLFCYLLSPLFIRLMKSKKVLIIFIIVFIVRLSIDVIQETDVIFVTLHTHVNPFVRSLEFFMGMLLVPIFMDCKQKIYHISKLLRIVIFSFIEISACIILFYLMYSYLNICFKTYYVLLFCMNIFIFAFDEGIFSKILGSKVFKQFNSIQFEFYLSHTTFLAYCNAIIYKMNIEIATFGIKFALFVSEFLLLTLICIIYNKLLKPYLSNLMRKFFHLLYSLFGFKLQNFLMSLK